MTSVTLVPAGTETQVVEARGVCRLSLIFKTVCSVFQDSEVELLEEDPHRPGEGWSPGLLPGSSEQEPSLLDPLPRWGADAAGGLERTAQAVLWTPGSPGK